MSGARERVFGRESESGVLAEAAEDRKNNLPVCVAGWESVWTQVGR